MTCDRILINWLNEAYDVEQAIVDYLESFSETVEDDELKNRIEVRIVDTNNQAEKILERIEQLGGDLFTTRSNVGSLISNLHGVDTDFEINSILKGEIVSYGIKYFERAVMRVLLTLASECDDDPTIALCVDILKKEEEGIETIDQELIGTSIDYLNKEVIEEEKIDFSDQETS